jgi:hypothetical protein
MKGERIRWLKWGKNAFSLARKEGKPVLLDIFGSWCHWCHEMAGRTYSDPRIIKYINRNFVAVKVDTDKRPDINERYNQGGWPTTAFLDYAGNVIEGTTYVPPELMLPLLERVNLLFRKWKAPPPPREMPARKGVVTGEIILHMEELVKASFDPIYGGFGEPKFPMPEVLEFMIWRSGKPGGRGFMQMAEKTLEGIISGIYDAVEGGFYRYSVSRDWKLPHYEKMLETNAGLLKVLSLVCRRKNKYLVTLRKTASYLMGTLASPDGGFYASQEADGEERYYGLVPEERKKMPPPSVDKTIFADLNGFALRGMAAYFEATKDKKARVLIEKTFSFLEGFYSEERGFAHYTGKKPVFLGLMRDQVNMGLAFLEASRILGRKKYLARARAIAEFVMEKYHAEDGGFYDKLPGGEGRLSLRKKRIEDNSRASLLFTGLGGILHKPGYRKIAEETLEAFAMDYREFGLIGGEYALAAGKLLEKL